MRITSISLKDFKGVTGEFIIDERNLIVGPNGCGKTAILQAIQWAIEGRTACGGTLEATALLAGVNGCRVMIFLDDGFTWGRELRRDNREHKLSEFVGVASMGITGKAAQAAIVEHVGKNGELFAPMFDLHDFLDLSEDKRRNFIMALCGRASNGEVPLDVLEQVFHEFYVLALGEGTVGDQANPAMLPMLSAAQQIALAKIADSVVAIPPGPSIPETLAYYADSVRDIALRSKRTKDEARQAARRLADEKAAAAIIAENLDSLEGRLTANQTAVADIGEQIANQAGRVSGRGSLARTIELNQLKLRNLVAMPDEKVDDVALAEVETKIAEIQARTFLRIDVNRLREVAADLDRKLAEARSEGQREVYVLETLNRTKERLASDIATLRGGAWMIVSQKLADALKQVMSESLRSILAETIGIVEGQCKDAADLLLELSALSQATERDIVEAVRVAGESVEGCKHLTIEAADANAALAAALAEQSRIDAQRGSDARELDTLRRRADGLRQAKLHRDVRDREIKAAQDAMLDAQRQIDQLDAEGGFIPTADLESQRAGLLDQATTIRSHIAAKRRALATDEQLTKCLAAAEQDEVLHATAETMRDAIRVVRETLMVDLVKPLMDGMRDFLANALGDDYVPYCRLEKDNGKPIFELGWNVGDCRVAEPALSGGERAIFGAALAYALVRIADPPLKLLLIEGAELDDEHSKGLFSTLAELPGIDNVLVAAWHSELFVGRDQWNQIRLPMA